MDLPIPALTTDMPSTASDRLLKDRLQNAEPGEPVDRWVYSAFLKDGWTARKCGGLTSAEHPGTALQVGNELFEIVMCQEIAEPGYAARYGLRKWNPQHAVRRVIPYTAETQAQAAQDYVQEQRAQKLRRRILWLLPLAGLAPGPLQQEWERRTGLSMVTVSTVSAILMVALWVTLVRILGPTAENRPTVYWIMYLGLESLGRLFWIALWRKPRGMLLLTLPYTLWRALTSSARRHRERDSQFTYEEDEIIRRASGHLVIRSMLFDEMLVGPELILFEGSVYRPLHWHEEGEGLSHRVIYEFEKVEADPVATKTQRREYTRPRSPECQQEVEAFTHSLQRVRILALLWGTYPREEQLRLEAKYHFPAVKWTAVTAGLLLVVALLQIWGAILWHTTISALTGPVYVILESLYRLCQSKLRKRPAASLAGYLLGLFLRPPR